MKNDEMLNLCKKVVVDYYNGNVEKKKLIILKLI